MLRDYCAIILFPATLLILDKSYFTRKPNILLEKTFCKVAAKIFKWKRGLTQILLQLVSEVNHTRSQVMTNPPWEKDWVQLPKKNASTSNGKKQNSVDVNLKQKKLMLLMTSSAFKTTRT